MMASRHLAQLSRLALLVAACDLATKYAAIAVLSGKPIELTDWLRLAVVHNDKGAFSISLGTYTRQLNLALTLCAIALIVPVSRDLARVDRWAPTALGLIVGGALGNLTSLILSTRGVVDFISLRTGPSTAIVLNIADIAAYAGLALLCRTGFLLATQIRLDVPSVPANTTAVRALALVSFDREVAIPLTADRAPDKAEDFRPRDGFRPRKVRRGTASLGPRGIPSDAPPRPDELTL
jgi:signal peptidase II